VYECCHNAFVSDILDFLYKVPIGCVTIHQPQLYLRHGSKLSIIVASKVGVGGELNATSLVRVATLMELKLDLFGACSLSRHKAHRQVMPHLPASCHEDGVLEASPEMQLIGFEARWRSPHALIAAVTRVVHPEQRPEELFLHQKRPSRAVA